MAIFREVNKAIKITFPTLDIEVVRGEGYIYFDGLDGFDKIDSVYAHPTSTSTDDVVRMCAAEIQDAIDGGRI